MVEITSEYLASQGLSQNFPQRFWGKVKKTDACWLWTACTDDRGYGYVQSGIGGRSVIAPRASWILCRGPIPNELCVLHNCPTGDNPTCVNPDHLWLGTRTENMVDKINKGRQLRGEQIGTHKLSVFQVIADKFGLCIAGMHKIIHRETWRHVD